MKSKITKIQILKREITVFLAIMFMTTPIMTATTGLNINTNTAETNTIQNGSADKNKSVLGFDLNEFLDGKVGSAVNEINKKLEAGETIIEISNEIQLRALAEIVNNEKNGLKDITIIIADDIIINSDEEWTPIGTQETPFEGHFIGGKLDKQGNLDTSIERCISNLKFTKSEKEYEELTNVGLFGVIGEFGLIQDIVIDYFNIDILYESLEEKINIYYYNAGNIAGINKGTIRDCTNYSDIKGGTCVGGIVGYNEGKISNCINAGIIMGDDNTDGIAGQNIGKIENCFDINNMSDEEAGISLLSMGDDPYIETTKNENEIDITELFPKTKKEKDIEPVDAEKTTVTYEIKKSSSKITDKTYLTYHKYSSVEYGDTLTVKLTYNRYIAGENYIPVLKMLDENDKQVAQWNDTSIQSSEKNHKTIITYTYIVNENDNFKIDKLSIEGKAGSDKNEDSWAIGEKDTAIGINGIKAVIPVEIIVDTTAPELKSVKAYVDEKLETSRYTAEKEVLFELTINKAIDELKTKEPDIEVSFSKSGRGLYNYSTDKKKAGYAKYRSDLTRENEDGTYTMVYSYKIQEGDEGILAMGISGFTLVDLAGNTTIVDQNTNIVEIDDHWIDIDENKIEDMDIRYKIYQNGKEITQRTTFKKGQSFSIEFTFDKILYAIIGKYNANEDVTSLLSKYPEYAPKLYLNNIIPASSTEVVINEAEGTTKITYNYSINDILNGLGILSEKYLENATIINSIGLYNANRSLGEEIDYIGGSTPYCEKIYETAETCIEHKDEFKYIRADAYKIMGLDFNIVIDSGESGVTYDIDDIYADTTSPTVKITTDTTDPTNASEITYTFEFSESVRDFAEEDITVNGGTVVKGSFARLEGDSKLGEEYGKKYQIKVKPLISDGEEGMLQVIVEKGACVDQVAKENVRQESNIKIDKVKPVFESYSIKEEDSKIVAEFIYNEALKNGEIALRMTIGGKPITLVRDIEVAESEDAKDYNYTLKIDENNLNKIIYTYYKDPSDGGKVEEDFEIKYVLDLAGNMSESKTVKLEDEIILEQTVVKSETDDNVSYTFNKNGVGINNFSQPTYFKAGDIITVVKHEEIEVENEGKKEKQYKTTNYEYTITEEDVKAIQNNSNPVQITNIELTEPPKKDSNGSLEIVNSATSDSINITEANIYFDVVAPEVELSVKVNEPNINNVYTKGEELIITATTNEAIQETEAPKIRVSFTNSGIGKYNDGNASYQETIINENGTTTWLYKYIAQGGDDGKAIIEYATEKTVLDLAGNAKTLKTYPEINKGDINITDIEIGENIKVSFEIYKDNEKLENFTNNTYFANGDCIRVVAKFDKLIYGAYNDDERNLLNKNTAPTLKMNDKKFEVEEELVNDKNIAKIEHDKEEYKTTVTYIYEVKAEDAETQLTNLSLSSSDKLVALHKELKEPEETEKAEKTEETEPEEITVTKEIKVNISKDITNCNLHIYNSSTIVSGREITVDTIKPKVNIKAQYEVTTEEGEITYNTIKGPTNLEKILYTFEFSEEIESFDIDDIIVNGGTKGTLQEETSGKVYKLEITPDVSDGNEGNVQVIVEKDSCTDKAGFGNIRAENNVKVDRKAPTLLGLEAYAPIDSNIKLNEKINIEQEYYKTNATLKIVATFDESVTTEAKLSLQFGEEKAKGKVEQEGTTGNKITYTYKIVDGDEGKLSVASYRGKALDSAGNEITVTKRELSGDIIIADTTSPTLKELKVVSPGPEITETEKAETETTEIEKPKTNNKYKAGNKVTIEAIFDEEIYVLEENEIKLIDTHIEVKNEEETEEGKEPEITITNNAPTLIIKFGNGEEREAIVEGYGTKEDGSIDKTKIIYTYTIVEEHIETEIQEINGEEKEVEILCSGDNGELKVVSYKNKENVEVCDLAGNIAIFKNNLTGNKIIADTIVPTVYDVWADVEEPTVGKTGIYHKAGNIATIYVQFSEKIESARKETKPQIKVFGKKVECDEILEDGVTAKFTYEIADGDNGYLRITVPGAQFKDMAGNENVQEYYLQDGDKEIEKYWDCEDVYADTEAPTVTLNRDTVINQTNQTITISANFSELIYDLNANRVVTLSKDKALKLIYSFGTGENKEVSASDVNGSTITYNIKKDPIRDNGTLHYELSKGNLCDRAGNEFYNETSDTTAPELKTVNITSNSAYGEYCKKDINIYVTAKFNEEISNQIMELRFKIGEGLEQNISGNIDNEDKTKIIFNYKVKDGDNGEFKILDVQGNTSDDEKLADKTYGYVRDKYGNQKNIYNLNDISILGNVVADTTAPKVTITSDVEKTNGDTVIYTFTWSESVTNFTKDDIELMNGLMGEFDKVKNTQDKVYKLKVDRLAEGMQIIRVLQNICEDLAGNLNNEKTVYNKVFIDCTKPVIRAKVNGGTYVVGTKNQKSILKETILVNEELSKFEYTWSTSETVPETGFESVNISSIMVNSDINLTKEISLEENQDNVGYYLYIKVTDLAGNVLDARTNEFIVMSSAITLTPSKTDATNENIEVSIDYDEALTENRKAGISGKTQSADSNKVIVSENGIVYAEASDKAGNKVYNMLEITNIDKTVPEATITYQTNEDNTVTATINFNEKDVTVTNNSNKTEYIFTENGEFTFEFKDKAGNKGTAVARVENIEPLDKSAPTISFNYTLLTVETGTPINVNIVTDKNAKISYSWDNKNWTTSKNFITNVNVTKKYDNAGKYTLYAKATDEYGNESDIQTLEFTVVNSSGDIPYPQIVFEDLPMMKVDGVYYVKVAADMTTENVTNKMDKKALCNVAPEYKNLTEDGKLKNGSEITLNGDTKYVVIVNGDVNCDGKIDFLGDIITANNYRIGIQTLSTMQKLAADINNDGKVEFISDVLAINNYRIGVTNSL